ncbi:MAG: tyrosine-protein phosphatase [Clostridium lundense]|nr:tyrosine-protein phosphatase [Clostridium lundense]
MQKLERIELDGTVNTRDLGGIKTMDGQTIQPHRLLRSDRLTFASVGDKKKLTDEINLRLIVDFRTERERSQAPDPIIPNVRYEVDPILESSVLGITHEAESSARSAAALRQSSFDSEQHMKDLYRTMGESTYTIFHYRIFFRQLLDMNEGAVLWHCSTGKDRAGIAAALILKVLGVDDETIHSDYMRTNDFIADRFCCEAEEILSEMPEGNEKDLCRQRYLAMFTGRPYYIDIFFDSFIKKYGSIESAFANGLGLGRKEIDQLKVMYLCR